MLTKSSYLFPTTEESYEAACKKRGQAPASEILQDGTKAYWLGDRTAEKVVLNFHGTSAPFPRSELGIGAMHIWSNMLTRTTGGGYVLAATADQFELFFQILDVLKKQGTNASCLFLDYGTSLPSHSLTPPLSRLALFRKNSTLQRASQRRFKYSLM